MTQPTGKENGEPTSAASVGTSTPSPSGGAATAAAAMTADTSHTKDEAQKLRKELQEKEAELGKYVMKCSSQSLFYGSVMRDYSKLVADLLDINGDSFDPVLSL